MDRTGKHLIMIPAFNAQFQALRYMEFSMEGVQQAVVLSHVGEPCLVSVPNPARMAIHTLIVSGQQSDIGSGTFATKANKDIARAASLIAFYAEQSPSQIVAAYKDAMSRGSKCRAALEVGLQRLRRALPQLELPWK